MAIISIPNNANFPFAKNKWMPVILFVGFIAACFIASLIKGINYGIDFKGGIVIEAELPANQSMDLNEIRSKLKKALGNREISIQEIGAKSGKALMIRTEKDEKKDVEHSIKPIKDTLDHKTVYRKIEFTGPKVGQELINNGIKSVFWALFAITLYVCVRFKWQYGVCSILALLHDCVGIIGFFAVSQKEFNEGAVVAILITASYSINDTVIIFDRIREKLAMKRGTDFSEIVNRGINETLPRTILTSTTTLLALFTLYMFGGNIVSDFSLPILIGIFIGSYSSIFISGPLLVWFKELGATGSLVTDEKSNKESNSPVTST
ncbi:protein translocase subunit SecF [Candidatus Hydrogenosomobacter endosymbioticus]|uniref:Protein-export membrane protein SecF n=1 Tax=Candidatus Hydrogenosomobacter endosymbioticus TaxID=2558174 RepID=A0ABM7V8L8_9PROT|nr:protein translocase subunit SecF [Candidatus Hydrogenosomobacter endosymbioticus]BDB96130.1 hypothetical protein HYD_2630 [Candidatus Hydrogenosomobacter endosymbioticus]